MKTAEEIQDEYAESKGFETFYGLLKDDLRASDFHVSKVQELYADQFKQKWVPVDEMLPDKGGGYNVVVIDGAREFVMSLRFSIDNDSWFFIDPSGTAKITHWQPLPSAPERKEVFKP